MTAIRARRFFELPLLAKELNEQSAQKRTYIIRFVYGLVLFTTACGMFYGSFLQEGGSTAGLGQGRRLFEKLVELQFWTIYLFLPAVSCGCLTLEKERNTLGLLLITTLSPWQIVFQKLLGRLIPMLTFVVLSFPLMAVAYSFGGFSVDYLWSGLVLLVVTCAQAGALAVMCSAWYATTVEAFIAHFVLFLVLYFVVPYGWGPYLFRRASDAPFLATLAGLVFPLGFTAVFLVAARLFLPARAFTPPKNVLLSIFQRLDRFFNNANTITGGVILVRDGEPLPTTAPVAWRETTKKSLGTFRYLFRVLVALELPLIVVGSMLQVATPGGPDVRIISNFLYILWALAGAMIIVHAGSVITSERTRQTLDVLLATPMSGSQILREKLVGVERLIHVLLIPFCTIFGFEIWWHQGSEYRWLHLALSLGTLVAYLPLLKWLALGIGLRVRSQMKAVGLMFTLAAVWLLLPDVIRAILVTMAGIQVPGWCEALFALNPKVQIPAIEDLNISARMATAKMTREALVPFIVLTILNLVLHTAAGFLVRRYVLKSGDRLLGRLEPPTAVPPEPVPAPA